MLVVSASATIEDATPDAIRRLERVGRTCYKSESKIGGSSAAEFCTMLLKRGHLSVFDHASASVRFVVDRGISHEIVRHRIGVGYSQESTRYCNYSKNGIVTFVCPPFWGEGSGELSAWRGCMESAESAYLRLVRGGAKPEEARSVLPSSVKTELVATGTFTYWRHFFKLRTHKTAHPQMRQVAVPLLAEFKHRWAPVFEDL